MNLPDPYLPRTPHGYTCPRRALERSSRAAGEECAWSGQQSNRRSDQQRTVRLALAGCALAIRALTAPMLEICMLADAHPYASR
ncbi:hypothetical protein GCM10023159_31450 [Brevibacterium yomogidense]